jgi:hypothetical protein
MKILIMVLSCLKPPYDKLYDIQLKTFDTVKVDDVDTHFYFGNEYELMHVAFRDALREVWDRDWDIILRTNSSSYINKQALKLFLKDKEYNDLWIGDTTGYNSGAGFIINRDLAKILMDEITDDRYPYEDLLCHNILQSKGYICQKGSNCNYNHPFKLFDTNSYQIRVKSSYVNDINRQMDINAMLYIHSVLQ